MYSNVVPQSACSLSGFVRMLAIKSKVVLYHCTTALVPDLVLVLFLWTRFVIIYRHTYGMYIMYIIIIVIGKNEHENEHENENSA